jgi:hypothetical protein
MSAMDERSERRLALATCAGVCLVAAACASSSGTASRDASPLTEYDAAATPPSADAGDGSTVDAAPPPPQTYLRVAQLAPDLPAMDVCVAPHGTTTFQGPLVGQLGQQLAADAGADADASGLTYAQVSAYLPLAPGQYDVRLVAAGASSCTPLSRPDADGGEVDAGGPHDAEPNDGSAPEEAAADVGSTALTDTTDLPLLRLNTYATLLVVGESSPSGKDAALRLSVIPDDAVLAGAGAMLRGVNAVPSVLSLDFGLESPAQWAPLLVNVKFAGASQRAAPGDGTVDSNGYLPIAPFSPTQELSARTSADAATNTAVADGVEIDMGSIATVIAIGGKTGDTMHRPSLLVCIDNQPSGGLLSDCSVAHP